LLPKVLYGALHEVHIFLLHLYEHEISRFVAVNRTAASFHPSRPWRRAPRLLRSLFLSATVAGPVDERRRALGLGYCALTVFAEKKQRSGCKRNNLFPFLFCADVFASSLLLSWVTSA
jgi:hypothetical protein